MKIRFLAIALFITAALQAQNGTEWKNITVTSVNKEPARTKFMTYDRREDAETFSYAKSPFYLPLTGVWERASATTTDLSTLKPPMLPAENPVARYSSRFEIPVLWLDRNIYLHIGAPSAGVYLKVNGQMVGYTEDSANPAEFDISQYITDGQNSLEMDLYKWTTGSWLENNFVNGGTIAGDVYIYSQPKIHIDDFTIKTTFDSTYTNAMLEIKIAAVNNFNAEETATIYFDLMNSKGEILRYNYADVTMAGMGGRDTVRFEAAVPRTSKWSEENPEQYQFMFRTRDGGRFTEYIPYKSGIRSLEMKNGQYQINGKPLILKGIVYKYTPETADEKGLRKYLETLKRNNINAIRVVFHPNKNYLYELCNEYGIYVCDEVNLDSHLTGKSLNVGGTLGNDPKWLNTHTSRVDNVYGLSRNFAGVVMLSLGNEAGNGYNMYKTYDYAKTIDSLRPVVYTGAANLWNTDVYFPKNPADKTFGDWAKNDDQRMFMISDFSLTDKNVDDYRELWRNSEKFQGGFYGGEINDNLKYLYQNVYVKPIDVKKGTFKIFNDYDSRNLSSLSISYTVTSGGKTLKTGVLSVTLAGGSSKNITIPVAALAKPGNELTITAKTKVKDATYPLGYVVSKQKISF